jgi:putative transposase
MLFTTKSREDGKIISKAVYTIYGIDQDGERDILGLYMNIAEELVIGE